MRILAVSSQVAFGPVGNTAAIPALQAKGHEVLGLPTIMLSNHPGHGRPAALHMPAETLESMLAKLDDLKAFRTCNAVMTGYFANEAQVDLVADCILRMKQKNASLFVLVDPIIGDHGAVYVPEAVAFAIKTRLLPLADCLTPNHFELEWLSGQSVTDAESACTAANGLQRPEILMTSIPHGEAKLATVVTSAEGQASHVTERREGVPHGTGDFLAGLYLAERMTGADPKQALFKAMTVLERAIALSAGSAVLAIEAALDPS